MTTDSTGNGVAGRRPSWPAQFDVPASPSGAVVAVDIDDAGLWAGRVVRGEVVRDELEPRIRPAVLDVRTATYLRETGAVTVDSGEAFAELVRVVGGARVELARRETVLTMGEEHLRLVAVSLADLIEATVPEANRAHGMVIEMAGRDPVDAVLLGPGHDAWPGLWEALTERSFSVLLQGDPFPAVFGGDEGPTEMFAEVAPPQPVRAWGDVGDPAAFGLDRFGNALADPASEVAGGDAVPAGGLSGDDEDVDVRPGVRGRVLAVAALVMLAVGGGGVALAMNVKETSSPGVVASTAPTTGETSRTPQRGPEPEHVNGSVDPAALRDARVPVSKYTSPTPTSTKTKATRSAEPPLGPQPKRPPRHTRRTIPNPIPGLPPIVIG